MTKLEGENLQSAASLVTKLKNTFFLFLA